MNAKEEKSLLLVDLCARLPYGVKVQTPVMNDDITLTCGDISAYFFNTDNKVFIKPYLRPMSSMTKEEDKKRIELGIWRNSNIKGCKVTAIEKNSGNEKQKNALTAIEKNIDEALDWLNAHHFDYRGLIEKGLAIAVTKENNPYKE